MIVVCINNFSNELHRVDKELTLNKQYEVVKSSYLWGSSYSIINDLGRMGFYNKKRFIKLEDFRNDKLDELGI